MTEEQTEGQPELIYIADEDGNEEAFEVIMYFDVDGSDNKYLMAVPVDGDPDIDEVYPFRYEEDGDDLKLYMIESDEEWELVEETFNTLVTQADEEDE